MAAVWRTIQVVNSRVRLVGLLLLAALVGWATTGQIAQSTPFGTQCPTATVQTVLQPLTCCGKTVGYAARSPKPGDKGFVQCRCAEKRAAEHQATVDQGRQHFEMLCAQPLRLSVPRRPLQSGCASTLQPILLWVLRAPEVPPPSAI